MLKLIPFSNVVKLMMAMMLVVATPSIVMSFQSLSHTTSSSSHHGRGVQKKRQVAVSTPTLMRASTLDSTETEQLETTRTTTTTIDPNEQQNKSPSSSSSSSKTTTTTKSDVSFGDRIANSGVASAAAMATAAVNAAVAMKTLEAPDTQKSYIAMDQSIDAKNTIDENGLPLIYDKDLIQAYWSKERGALNQRWGQFVGKAVPFLTKLTTLFIRDGKIEDAQVPGLAKQARMDMEDLGPTFVKLGQMMSVRPDVLPQPALDELQLLQDSVIPFDSEIAVQQIETELGGPLGQFFTSISEKPVAAASLAQVYMATLNDGNDTRVAVKVQRPDVLGTVSKDLYVLRRAAEVFDGLIKRFAPQQQTDYVALLNEWAIGFYTELDFQNEMSNQKRLRQILLDANITDVTVPRTYDDLCTRRILVSEWMDGKKLSACTNEEIADVTPAAQEAFLTQLFSAGFLHADPHAGNILMLNEPTPDGARVALIDCGLMAAINEDDRDNFVSAVIHLANKSYGQLVDDFIKLGILPPDSNRAAIIPLMDKALSPYVKGGGAKKYEEELKKIYKMDDGNLQSQVGGFQAMTQDALTVLESIPFSIPPSFALLGRAVVTLEGIALTGNPSYGIIMESYPFIARKLLQEGRPEIQKALQEVLYSGSDESSGLKLTRLLALLNNAAGAVATKEGAAFVDLDAVPEDGLTIQDGLKFVLSDKSDGLRNLLESEVDNMVDVLSRQLFRRGLSEAVIALTPPQPPRLPFVGDLLPPPPALDKVPLPILLPGIGEDGMNRPSVAVLTLEDFTNMIAPKLNQDEEIFAIGLADGAKEFFGDEIGDLLKGERVLSTQSIDLVIRAIRSGAFGRNDLLSGGAAKAVVEFVENALQLFQQQQQGGGVSSSSSSSSFEQEFLTALDGLSISERERFDEILNELTQRALQRAVDRLQKVNRII